MIDLKTGIMEFDGVRITPTITIADLRSYGEEKMLIIDTCSNRAVAILNNFVMSNGISAEIDITVDEEDGTRDVTIAPAMDDPHEAMLLEASKQWLKGEAINGTYTEDDWSIFGKYDWGYLSAMYHDDRDWGTVGGEIQIIYE